MKKKNKLKKYEKQVGFISCIHDSFQTAQQYITLKKPVKYAVSIRRNVH